MNLLIYNFLLDYYKIESTNLNIDKNRFAIDYIEKMYINKKITMRERNELLINVKETILYVIKVLSECPYININLNNYTKYLNAYKGDNEDYF